jgi:hypothetical protein
MNFIAARYYAATGSQHIALIALRLLGERLRLCCDPTLLDFSGEDNQAVERPALLTVIGAMFPRRQPR